jgi:hypothetical protein
MKNSHRQQILRFVKREIEDERNQDSNTKMKDDRNKDMRGDKIEKEINQIKILKEKKTKFKEIEKKSRLAKRELRETRDVKKKIKYSKKKKKIGI